MTDAGVIEPSATVEFYDAGTTTPRTVYSDRALSTTAGTSVTADANGVCAERWVADSVDIKLIYKDAAGATKYTRDYFNDSLNSTLLANIAGLTGTNAYFLQFTGASTVQSFNLFGTANTWTATQTGSRWSIDANGYFTLSSSNALLNLDATDYIQYDRAANRLDFVIGASTKMQLLTTGLNLEGDFLPLSTEAHDLGSAAKEWDNVYSQNAVTVSDQRRKTDIGIIDGEQALKFIHALEPRLFRFKPTIVPAREDAPERVIEHKRPHAGFFAQQVKAAMDAAGIDDCGVYAYNDENDTHELRLFEMIAFLVAGMKELAAHRVAPPEVRYVEVEKIVHVEVPVAVEVPAAAVEPDPPAEPYVPDFTLIPDALSRYAAADESADDFRQRLKSYWQRFGIADGENFPGGGETLTGEEKIQMREIDILLNSDEGKAARLHDWLFAD